MTRAERDAWVAALRDKSVERDLTCTAIRVLRDEFGWRLPIKDLWATQLVCWCIANGMTLDDQADWIEANVPVTD